MEGAHEEESIQIKRIIAPYLSGDVSGVIGEGDRVTAFETLRKVIEDQQGGPNKCPLLDNDEESAFHIVKRIGSESKFAQVYEVGFRDYPGVKAAMKVMPIESSKTGVASGLGTFDTNLKEIRIAGKVSTFVQRGITPYFPYFYGAGFCKFVEMQAPDDDLESSSRAVQLFNRAKIYSFRETIIEQLTEDELDPEEEARLLRRKLHGWSIPRMAAYYERRNRGMEFTGRYNFGIRAHVMLVELAYGDLYQFIKKGKFTDDVGPGFIGASLEAIDSMHTILGVAHNDLHIKNVLVAYQKRGPALIPVPLIHDFGHATDFEGEPISASMQKGDVERFVRTLQSQRKIPLLLRGRLTDLINDMNNNRINTASQALERWTRLGKTPGFLETSIKRAQLFDVPPLEDEHAFDEDSPKRRKTMGSLRLL